MALAWTYKDWHKRFPSMNTDELCRHTLIIPNPFKVTSIDPKYGTKYRPALVLVVAPWWLCRYIFDAEERELTQQARRTQKLITRAEKELKATKPFIWDTIEDSTGYTADTIDAAWDEFFSIRDRLEAEELHGQR